MYRTLALSLALVASGGCAVLERATESRTRKLAREGVQKHSAEVNGDHIEYWDGGHGDEVVLLLHGFGGDALFQWFPQMRALSEQHRLIAPDLLWFGDSHSQTRDFSVQYQANAVNRLLDELGVERAHIVGLSYGGIVTHELLAQAPERFDRVVLVSSPGRAFVADDKTEDLKRLGADSAQDVLLPRDHESLKRLMSLAYHDPPWVPRFAARQVVARFYAARRTEQVALLNGIEAHTQRHRSEHAAPQNDTLIVWGEHDRIFPESAAWRLRRELGEHARACVLENAAHAPHLERERDVTPLLLGFLAEGRVECAGRTTELPSVAEHADPDRRSPLRP